MELIHPEVTAQALAILRQWDQLQGNVIPLLALVVYVYATEIQQANWNGIAAGALPVFATVYVPFFAAAVFAHDWPRARPKRFVGGLFAFDAALLVLFGPILRWI